MMLRVVVREKEALISKYILENCTMTSGCMRAHLFFSVLIYSSLCPLYNLSIIFLALLLYSLPLSLPLWLLWFASTPAHCAYET